MSVLDPVDRHFFRRALALEADWGLGRNPLNVIQMTTASTPLAWKRSVPEAYTSGTDDGGEGHRRSPLTGAGARR